MTPAAQHPARERHRRPRRTLRWAPLWLLLAVTLSLLVYLPFTHWVLEWRMAEYLVPWLLRPSTGFLSLTLALWWLFTVPGTLHLLAGGGAAPAPDAAERIDVPAGPLPELGAGHRFEMAQALGIPWRDELIHDHRAWTLACSEAARARAADRSR
ncbi:MAG: hypothetical protein ACTH0H_00330 [Brachybacterium sp.]